MPILNVENIASTTEITTNGIHDVTQYTSANVNVDTSASITSIEVTPTTSAQTITAPAGTDGYSPINVSAVTSSIDSNIQPGNIKKDVEILGVTGSAELAPTYYVSKTIDANGKLVSSGPIINTDGITDLSDYALMAAYSGVSTLTGGVSFNNLTQITGSQALRFAFRQCSGLNGQVSMSALTSIVGNYAMDSCFANSGITGIDMRNLISVQGSYTLQSAFSYCQGLTSVNLSSLEVLNGSYVANSMFSHCTNLTSVDLSSLVSISGSEAITSMFETCSKLSNINLSSLKTIDVASSSTLGNAFGGTAITTMDFASLETITGGRSLSGAFNGCPNLTDVYFRKLKSGFYTVKTVFQNLLYNVNGCTIHFPSNLDPNTGATDISGLTGYPNFGGTNTVLVFDQPATE